MKKPTLIRLAPQRSFVTAAMLAMATLSSTHAHAEGTAELSQFGRVQQSTVLEIDVTGALAERITWRGQGTLTITTSAGLPVATLVSGGTTLALLAGTYTARLSQDQTTADFDIAVLPALGNTPVSGGRLHSRQWDLAINNRNQASALNHSFYALVGGGAPGKDALIDIDLNGFNGNFHQFGMNSTGVTGRTDGRSGPSGANFAPEFPLYLNPPAARLGGVLTPTITDLRFIADEDAEACSAVEHGVGGFFSLVTDVVGTAHVVCDVNGDGVASLVDAADISLIAATTPGEVLIPFNGRGVDGQPIDAGSYDCEAFVTTGELHFLGKDVETSYLGVRMYDVAEDNVGTTGLRMFWDDSLLTVTDVQMLNGEIGLVTSPHTGMLSTPKNVAPVPNVSGRAWGNFDDNGKRGNDEVTDTWTFARASTRAALPINIIEADTDSDGDGISDLDELCLTGTDPDDDDSDDDGIIDGNEDADHDGVLDDGETDPNDADTDGDGLQDGTEIGLTAPQGDDTNPATFIADADGSTTTDPRDVDTDDGSVSDGVEDTNHNGRVDEGERDPLEGTDDLGADSDGDGIPDDVETATGTDPDDADSDDDGIADGNEDADHDGVVDDGETDPRDVDSDNDGIQDGTELGLTTPQTPDTDTDTFVPDADPTTTTDPDDADTDDGGIADGIEDANHDGAIDPGEGNPNDPVDDVIDPTDSDGDGIPDAIEDATGTDPDSDDSDGDGIPDGIEDTNHNGIVDDGETDPRNDDSDGDGIKDGVEDSDHDGIVDQGETDPNDPDTDGDGLPDGIEDADKDGDVDDGETDPTNPDTDGDSLKDGDEDADHDGSVDEGETDPRDPDTDDDGICDAPAITIAGVCEPGDGDSDGDGVLDGDDNCPDVENADQADGDDDDIGDVCDADADGDGYVDAVSIEGGGVTSCSQGQMPAPILALLGLLALKRRRRS